MQSTENINKYGEGRDHLFQPNRVGCQVRFPVGCIHALPGGEHGPALAFLLPASGKII